MEWNRMGWHGMELQSKIENRMYLVEVFNTVPCNFNFGCVVSLREHCLGS